MTAGDPDASKTVDLMHALVAGGADLIELGVPFSDPMADGPVIQRASARALARSITLERVLEDVQTFRQRNSTTPVILMGYANPIERMGLIHFVAAARAAGVDGVLTVDYPPEEAVEYASRLIEHEIDPIFLLAPTSNDARIAAVAQWARGYVYYVSLKGVTGATHLDHTAITAQMPVLKAKIPLPIAVGFGIRDADTARSLAGYADAVIIGSRIVQLLEEAPPDCAAAELTQFMATVRSALDIHTPHA